MSASEKHIHAQGIVKNQCLISMGAGLVPIPIVDIAAVTAIQMDMVKQLSWLYNVPYPGRFDKSLITALTGSIFARVGASVIKAIPIVGSIIGGVSMAIMSGASTYAVGQVFIRHFEAGGNFENFDPIDSRHYFKEAYEQGKQKAEDWKKEDNPSKNSKDQASTLEQLSQLNELKQAGAITEAEFKKMKKKLMENFE